MTVAFLVLWIVALASIIGAAYCAVQLVDESASKATVHLTSFFEERLLEQDRAQEARRVALYQQEKAMQRVVAASDRDVRKAIDHAASLRDEAIGLQQRVDFQLRRHEAA